MHITSCTSQNSIDIISSTMDIPSLSSSSSSSTFVPGGPTLDRHNPIITDEKRSGIGSKPGTPIGTPRTNHVLQQKPKTPTPTSLKKKNNKSLLKMTKNTVPRPSYFVDQNNENYDNHDHNDDDDQKRGDEILCEPSDLMMKAATSNISRANVDYISPPESSRYLLDDTSFLDVLSGFDPVLKLDPNNIRNSNSHVDEVSKFDKPPNKPPSSSSGSSDQVVVLRVLLHCRGCERKMKKHLSRMSGVTSFNIDFAAKKVTVVGDVTPLQVLASISKVKTAKLWSPTMPSSSINTPNMEAQN